MKNNTDNDSNSENRQDRLDADAIKKIVEETMGSRGFVYESTTGLFYDTQNELFYDQVRPSYNKLKINNYTMSFII